MSPSLIPLTFLILAQRAVTSAATYERRTDSRIGTELALEREASRSTTIGKRGIALRPPQPNVFHQFVCEREAREVGPNFLRVQQQYIEAVWTFFLSLNLKSLSSVSSAEKCCETSELPEKNGCGRFER